MEDWNDKLYQILLTDQEVRAVADDWLGRFIQSDLRLRRARTKGHVVVETSDTLFANNIRIWHPSCRVNIKDLKKQ